jgi:hypothetical protein
VEEAKSIGGCSKKLLLRLEKRWERPSLASQMTLVRKLPMTELLVVGVEAAHVRASSITEG